MAGENTQEVQVAAGAFVGFAPAGTAMPALAAADPIAPWTDLGYITEDGITFTHSRESENFGAWQSPTPIAVLVTALTDTFAFGLRQWSQDVFKFVFGIGVSAAKSFQPAKQGVPSWALLLKWDWLAYPSQLYIPRGTITGDSEAVLARTAPSDLAVEVVSTPSGAEPIWDFHTDHPAFAAPVTLLAGEGEGQLPSLLAPEQEAT